MVPFASRLLLIAIVLPLPLGASAGDQQTLPAEVDLRPLFAKWEMPPKSQGRRNTCSVFVTVGAFEFALSKRHDRAMPLSVE